MAVVAACLPDGMSTGGATELVEATDGAPPRLPAATALRALVARRAANARRFSICGGQLPEGTGPLTAARVRELWGEPAVPTDEALYEKAKQSIPWPGWPRSIVMRTALTNKVYRALGGRFVFPSRIDSFIEGLHRRTEQLHRAWALGRADGRRRADLQQRAVAEMLLRLRWDDSDDGARVRLSRILAQIWDRLDGQDTGSAAIPSALWLDEAGPGEEGSSMRSKEPTTKSERDDGWEKEPTMNSERDDGWEVVACVP